VKRALSFESLESRQLLSGLTPAELQRFYGLNHVYGKNPETKGAGISIAVVVAFDNPRAAQDVARFFDAPYHLPALSLTTYNLGTAGNQPLLSWSTEAESDIEAIHSIAPLTHIDLVEAADDGLQELIEADQYAASLPGVVVVSDSWGVPEFATESQLDTYLTAPGVTFVAATGDFGVPDYPSVSPDAIAVGGTWVTGNSEVPWSSAGVSQVYPGRQVPDVSMAVNSTQLTGTSVSAPLFAGLVGIADALRQQQGLSALSAVDVRSRIDSVAGTNQYSVVFKNVTRGQGIPLGASAIVFRSPKAPGLIGLLSS
jgi:subtilase family serine protease